jgi:hypothetical protein
VKCLKVILFLIFFFCFGGGVGAQICGFDALLNNHPELNAAFDASFLKKNKKEPENPSITYVIPVVFHILYDEENKNLVSSRVFVWGNFSFIEYYLKYFEIERRTESNEVENISN